MAQRGRRIEDRRQHLIVPGGRHAELRADRGGLRTGASAPDALELEHPQIGGLRGRPAAPDRAHARHRGSPTCAHILGRAAARRIQGETRGNFATLRDGTLRLTRRAPAGARAGTTMCEEGNAMGYKVTKTDEQWREELGDERYQVLRQAGTERAWTGELLDESRAGFYTCAACGAELFKSGTKFDSHCGWPSFYDSVNPDAVELIEDTSLGMVRTEVRCANCGGAPRPRLRRRLRHPDRAALLHELALARLPGRGARTRPTPRPPRAEHGQERARRRGDAEAAFPLVGGRHGAHRQAAAPGAGGGGHARRPRRAAPVAGHRDPRRGARARRPGDRGGERRDRRRTPTSSRRSRCAHRCCSPSSCRRRRAARWTTGSRRPSPRASPTRSACCSTRRAGA